MSGPLFQQDKDKPKCRNVRRISPPWLGKRWLNSVTTHLTNQCDHLINVTSNLPRCCRSRHTNIYFCVNRISTVSTLTQVKNVYCLKICSKCTGLLCLYQHEKNQTFIYLSRQVVFLPKSNRRIPVYLMTFYSRYFYMTVAQLQWNSCCVIVDFKKFLTKLLLSCFYNVATLSFANTSAAHT